MRQRPNFLAERLGEGVDGVRELLGSADGSVSDVELLGDNLCRLYRVLIVSTLYTGEPVRSSCRRPAPASSPRRRIDQRYPLPLLPSAHCEHLPPCTDCLYPRPVPASSPGTISRSGMPWSGRSLPGRRHTSISHDPVSQGLNGIILLIPRLCHQ